MTKKEAREKELQRMTKSQLIGLVAVMESKISAIDCSREIASQDLAAVKLANNRLLSQIRTLEEENRALRRGMEEALLNYRDRSETADRLLREKATLDTIIREKMLDRKTVGIVIRTFLSGLKPWDR